MTLPIWNNKMDFTMAPKYALFFANGASHNLGVNLGMSFSTDLNRWAVRPEFGVMNSLEGGGGVFQGGLSLSGSVGR